MDNAEALRLLRGGAAVLLLDLPPGATIGIDSSAWQTAAGFRGIKMIPPGFHMFYTSPPDGGSGLAPRATHLLDLSAGQVVPFRWDPGTESALPVEGEERERLTQAVREMQFDSGMAPYPLAAGAEWGQLAGHVTGSCVARVRPPQGRAVASAFGDDGGAAVAHPEHSGAEAGPSASLFWTPSDAAAPAGLRGPALTKWSLDTSEALSRALERCARHGGGAEAELLAELQLSFLLFLLGQHYGGFEQWKGLLRLLLGCDDAARDPARAPLLAAAHGVLAAQLARVPPELLAEADSSGGRHFLRQLMADLPELAQQEGAAPAVRDSAAALMRVWVQRFGAPADGGDADGPVVVAPGS